MVAEITTPASRCATVDESHRLSPPKITITAEPRLIAATQPRPSSTGPGSTMISIETALGMLTVVEFPSDIDPSVGDGSSVHR